MTLIALHSESRGAGKTATAQIIKALVPDAVIMSFADGVREMADALLAYAEIAPAERLRLVRVDKNEPISALGGVSARQLLIGIGTTFGRGLSPDFWSSLLATRIDRALFVGKTVVIDDLRFEEEYAAVQKRGGAVWTVEKPDADDAEPNPLHLVADVKLINGGTLQQLSRKVERLLIAADVLK